MIEKPIDQITKTEIDSLISTKTGERRTLDYKQELPGSSDADKREFLYDVSSFANGGGGDMVFGIAEERDADGKPSGLPGSADGVALPNLSDTILRLENIVRTGIDPRVSGIQWQPVDGFPKGPVLVMRIPQSWVGPHMVIFNDSRRFYSRHSAGKHLLSVGELRSAFGAFTAVGERLRHFRFERIAKAFDDNLPVPLGTGPRLLLHLVPMSALDPTNLRDYTHDATQLFTKLEPLSAVGINLPHQRRYNLDGMFTRLEYGVTYLQVFRSGIIECGDADLFKYTAEGKKIPQQVEDRVLQGLRHYLTSQEQLGVTLPIFLLVTLLGVNGFEMKPPKGVHLGQRAIDRDIVPLPEALMESYDGDVQTVVRPTFDALWQACGYERSFNYDDKGRWNPQP